MWGHDHEDGHDLPHEDWGIAELPVMRKGSPTHLGSVAGEIRAMKEEGIRLLLLPQIW